MHMDDVPPIPKFLRRRRTKESRERVAAILRQDTVKRSWAPIRKASEIPPRPSMPVIVDNPSLPVKVQVKEPKKSGSTLLATYANMAEFHEKHNLSTYPMRGQPVVFGNHTVVIVSAKPWADKEKNAVKRVGPKASAVIVNKTMYDSTQAAFEALKLPLNKLQKFRAELKIKRKLTFVHEEKKYNFSYPS
jgi:hypothetical protein